MARAGEREAPGREVQTPRSPPDNRGDVRERVRPTSPPRRPNGRRDVLIVATAVAVLFTVGSALGVFARLGEGSASGGLGEALGLALLALAGTAFLALRRSAQVSREQRLRETADARLRVLIEGSPAVSYSWDPATHRHLYVSPQVEQLLGLSPERYADAWVDMIHPDDRERVLASSAEADEARTRFVAEYRSYRADGALVWIREEANYVAFGEGGGRTLSQGVMYDITARKEADARAFTAERQFQTLVERVPAIAYVWDAAHAPGVVPATYISPQIEHVLGYDAADWMSDAAAWHDHAHPDDAPRVLEAWSAAVADRRPFVDEYRMRAADGSWRWLRDEANPVAENPGGSLLYQGVMLDITERHDAEDRLREAEERWRTLLEDLPVVAYMIGSTREGDVGERWVGPGIEALVGVSPDEWLGDLQTWTRMLHPDDRDDVLAAWEQTAHVGKPFDMEYRMIHRDGRVIWVHDQAVSVLNDGRFYAEGVFYDVTARRTAERALTQAEDRFRSLVERLPQMRDPGMWEQSIHPDDRASVMAADQEDTGDRWSIDHRSITRDGRVIWIHNDAELLRDGEGNPLYWQGVIYDITERKQAEERLREAEERYRTLVEQLPVAIYTDATDDLSTALYISPQYERLTGYTPEQRLMDPGLWVRMLHPEDRERVLVESKRTNETGDPFDVEYRVVRADGTITWLHDHAMVVAGPGGQRQWHGVLQDITAEKAAEEQLREAEERYRQLVEEIPAITYLDEFDPNDPDLWPTIYISPQVETILGYTPDEWQANPWIWDEMIHPDDRERVAEAERRHYEDGEPLDVEHRVTAKDGTVWWLRDQASIVRDEDGRPRFSHGFLIDVGERKAAEQAMHDAERRYRSLIETLPSVTYIDTLGEESIPVYVSPQVATIFGYGPDEWRSIDHLWRSRLHPDDLERTLDAVRAHAATLEPFDAEYRFRHRDGTWMWVRDQAVVIRDEEGTPLFSQGVMHDVTREKTAEDRLREAEERYRGIVEHIPAAIYLDRADASMQSVYVSPQILEIAGVTPEHWLEDPELWLRLMDPSERDAVGASYTLAATSGMPWSAEYRLHTPDGRTIWVHDETTFLHADDGAPLYLQGVIFDITERKLAEQALRESEQRERDAAERLRALDEMKNTFLAAVSHELRSPLTSILGLSLTLERTPEMPDADRGDLLRRLAQNASKLDRLLKDLLDIDRLNRGIVEPQYRVTDVGALARRTVESLDILTGREVVAEADAVVIPVDPAKVERIVENLLMNAARHTAPDRRIWLKVTARDGGVAITVEDDGPGVPAEIRGAIFEPFRQGPTASPHAPGTGIGLSLVARFAELHGGRAWVDEREGGGAAFHVFLPGQRDEAPAADAAPREDGQDEGDAQLSRADVG
ncbi:MAG: PAS domain S-box protein [Actinobacteria bacterium]|nr:MAG: PAS domain S-box protein [Actinomycetota bacterium]